MAERDVRGDVGVEPLQADRSLGELIAAMADDVSRLTRQEIQLAKVELQQEGRRAAKAGGLVGGAAVVGLVGAMMLVMAGGWLLDQWLPRAVAFLIVAVVVLVVAGVLYGSARKALRELHPVPEQTVASLKEDVAWVKAQKS